MRCATVVASVMLAVAPASAHVIFDNGVPAADSAPAYPLTQSVQSEDFSLSEASVITGLRFYAIERLDGYAGSISWSIRNSDSGQPAGNAIAGDTTTAVTRTLTGVIRPDHFNAPQAIYSMDIEPLALEPGQYWLVLHNGPLSHDDPDDAQGFFLWEGTIGQRGAAGVEDPSPFDGVWQQTFGEHSFALVGVPEPGTVAALGGFALFLLRRQRAGLLRR